MSPAWSRDGRWIYYSWSRAGERDIWRTRGAQGPKERVTHGGGFIGQESPDGTTLLYLPKPAFSPLFAQPLAGGRPRQTVACVAGTAFSVRESGVYYVACTGQPPDPNPPVHVLDPVRGTDRIVGTLERFQDRESSLRIRGVARWPGHPVRPAGQRRRRPDDDRAFQVNRARPAASPAPWVESRPRGFTMRSG